MADLEAAAGPVSGQQTRSQRTAGHQRWFRSFVPCARTVEQNLLAQERAMSKIVTQRQAMLRALQCGMGVGFLLVVALGFASNLDFFGRTITGQAQCDQLRVAFFTSFKPIEKDPTAAVRQENAVRSWLDLHLVDRVFVFGNEPSVSRFVGTISDSTQDQRLVHIPGVKTGETGTPYFDSMLAMAMQAAPQIDLFIFANGDIIFTREFADAIQAFCDAGYVHTPSREALGIGRRYEVPLKTLLKTPEDRLSTLQALTNDPRSYLQIYLYVDYFVIPRGLFPPGFVKPVAMGRAGVDDWIVGTPWTLGKHLVDLTAATRAYHQIHTYRHLGGSKQEAWSGKEAQHNIEIGRDRDITFSWSQMVISGSSAQGYQIRRIFLHWFVKCVYDLGVIWLFKRAFPLFLICMLGAGAVVVVMLWAVWTRICTSWETNPGIKVV